MKGSGARPPSASKRPIVVLHEPQVLVGKVAACRLSLQPPCSVLHALLANESMV